MAFKGYIVPITEISYWQLHKSVICGELFIVFFNILYKFVIFRDMSWTFHLPLSEIVLNYFGAITPK